MNPLPAGNLKGQYPQGGNAPVPHEQPSPDSDIYIPPRMPSPSNFPQGTWRPARAPSLPETPIQGWWQPERSPPRTPFDNIFRQFERQIDADHYPSIPGVLECPTRQPPLQGEGPLQRSCRMRQPFFHLDNVYGNQNPADIFSNLITQPLVLKIAVDCKGNCKFGLSQN